MNNSIVLTEEKPFHIFYFNDVKEYIHFKRTDLMFTPYPGDDKWVNKLKKLELMLEVTSSRINGYEKHQISIDGRVTPYHREPIDIIIGKSYPESHVQGNPDKWHTYFECRIEMLYKPQADIKVAMVVTYDAIEIENEIMTK